jgi:hypothetical protein
MLIGKRTPPQMHSVERWLKMIAPGFHSRSPNHLMDELELEKKRNSWPIKPQIISDPRLPLFDQRWKNGCGGELCSLANNQIFS